jgi:hypothetical protein
MRKFAIYNCQWAIYNLPALKIVIPGLTRNPERISWILAGVYPGEGRGQNDKIMGGSHGAKRRG